MTIWHIFSPDLICLTLSSHNMESSFKFISVSSATEETCPVHRLTASSATVCGTDTFTTNTH